jgi:hypothetical protein
VTECARARYFLSQRVVPALDAISLRRSGVSLAALAVPPAAARLARARFGGFSPVTWRRMERAIDRDSSAISSGCCSRGGLLTGFNLTSYLPAVTAPLLVLHHPLI